MHGVVPALLEESQPPVEADRAFIRALDAEGDLAPALVRGREQRPQDRAGDPGATPGRDQGEVEDSPAARGGVDPDPPDRLVGLEHDQVLGGGKASLEVTAAGLVLEGEQLLQGRVGEVRRSRPGLGQQPAEEGLVAGQRAAERQRLRQGRAQFREG